jgi:hypothetical protein
MAETKPTGNKPVYKVASHGVTVSVWQQKSKKDGKTFYTAQMQRSYQDDNEEWQNTETLRMSDIPVAALLLGEAYKKYAIKEL